MRVNYWGRGNSRTIPCVPTSETSVVWRYGDVLRSGDVPSLPLLWAVCAVLVPIILENLIIAVVYGDYSYKRRCVGSDTLLSSSNGSGRCKMSPNIPLCYARTYVSVTLWRHGDVPNLSVCSIKFDIKSRLTTNGLQCLGIIHVLGSSPGLLRPLWYDAQTSDWSAYRAHTPCAWPAVAIHNYKYSSTIFPIIGITYSSIA